MDLGVTIMVRLQQDMTSEGLRVLADNVAKYEAQGYVPRYGVISGGTPGRIVVEMEKL